jgi:U3 small nucleolar RNA-associated protein 12
LWDSKISTIIVSFNGHRSAVTTLAFDEPGVRLASGSKDTDVILWDLVGEVGLFRLRGHKDQITALQFLPTSGIEETTRVEVTNEFYESGKGYSDHGSREGFLLTTGKDALIKLWDLASQHCIETHIAQTNGECWAMGISPDGSGCITGGNDAELRVWSIDLASLYRAASAMTEIAEGRFLCDRGTVHRQGKDKTLGISFHSDSDYIAVHGSEKVVEIWRVRPGEEIQKSMARKRKRRREKAIASAEKGGLDTDMTGEEERLDENSVVDITEVFVPYMTVRTGGKVRSLDWAAGKAEKKIRLLVSTTNNQLEVYDIPTKAKGKQKKEEEPPDYSRSFSVDMPGHRMDVRSLALSSDDRMLASASSGSLKIWNVRTRNCIRTFDCGYALCCSFLPGDKIVSDC